MTDNTDGHFDADVADRYDDDPNASAEVVAPVVERLAALAGERPALEFAIGTGRIALPLAVSGVAVSGIELSRAMVAKLREKPGGAALPVVIGDMTTARVEGAFGLVFLVYNTINNLVTQEAQVACFENAARHLGPGGRFVIEVGVPALRRLPPGETCVTFDRSEDHWGIDEFDVVTQAFSSHHLVRTAGGWVTNSVPFRYVWPSELDLMARIAGMTLESRHADWAGTPFGPDSPAHVSVWRKPG